MLWRDYCHLNPEQKITHATVPKQITKAWQMVSAKTVTSAWSVMDDEDLLDTEDLEDFKTLDDEEFRLYLNIEDTSEWHPNF